MDFDTLKVFLANNSIFQNVQDILFSDWPENEVYPESLNLIIEGVVNDVRDFVEILLEIPQLIVLSIYYLLSI